VKLGGCSQGKTQIPIEHEEAELKGGEHSSKIESRLIGEVTMERSVHNVLKQIVARNLIPVCPTPVMRLFIHTPECTLLYTSTIVHFPHIHHLLSPPQRDILRKSLLYKSFVCCLDYIHLIPRSRYFGSQVIYSCASGHFKNEMLASQTKS
jgi:hypothetical protein